MKNVLDIFLAEPNGAFVVDGELHIVKPRDKPMIGSTNETVCKIELNGKVALMTNENCKIIKAPNVRGVCLVFSEVVSNPLATFQTAKRLKKLRGKEIHEYLYQLGEKSVWETLDLSANQILEKKCKQVFRIFRGKVIRLPADCPDKNSGDPKFGVVVFCNVAMLGVK